MQLKQLLLVKLPNGQFRFIPIEAIEECPIIVPDEKTKIVVHRKTTEGAAHDGMGEHVDTDLLEEKHITMIEKNGGVCYTQVDGRNRLDMPRNANGGALLVLHLSRQ